MIEIDGKIKTRTTGTRQRSLTGWYLYDWGDGQMSVLGVVVADSESDKPEDATRLTRTSPIAYRLGESAVVTQSGSVYTLLKPSEGQDPNEILIFENRLH